MDKKKKLYNTIKTSVSLNEYYIGIIKQEIDKGKFNSVSEVVREGLRLIEKKNNK